MSARAADVRALARPARLDPIEPIERIERIDPIEPVSAPVRAVPDIHPERSPRVSGVSTEPPLLTPAQRLELLCDPGSLQVVRSAVESRRSREKSRPGDGVCAAHGVIDGRPVVCFAQDSRVMGGSLGEVHAETIMRALRMAGRARVPVVGLIESAGARMQDGIAALGGYARIFAENIALSGRVPQISILTGTSAGGGSYSPALTDFVCMTDASHMFLTGPQVVREVMAEDLTPAQLGGPTVHERNGVCHFRVRDELEAIMVARRLLGYLPQHAGGPLPQHPAQEPELERPGSHVPEQPRQVYDVRLPIRAIADRGSVLDVAPRWARNLVTCFARLEGRPIGIVANQPLYLGGVLDADSAQKGARFVRTCNAYGLPLLVLVDTPGFMPGSKQEHAGVIRHGAKLLHAFGEATVPRVTVVLRKAYGGAYITMNAKDLGADFAFAWPRTEIGIMGARQAVRIAHRRQLAAAVDRDTVEQTLVDTYAAEMLTGAVAAREGYIDEVIDPDATRERVVRALRALAAAERRGPLPLNPPL